MPRPFKIYRIICTLTDKGLVSGSDWPTRSHGYHPNLHPGKWHERGSWSATGGTFWKTEAAVRRHLQNLCHDWATRSRPSYYPRWPNERVYWHEVISGPPCWGQPDWSRLQFLRVEQIYITNYATTSLLASDFMGIPAESGPGDRQGSGANTSEGSPATDDPLPTNTPIPVLRSDSGSSVARAEVAASSGVKSDSQEGH